MNLANNTTWFPCENAEAFILAREVGEEILARLSWMTIKPQQILVLGHGSEALIPALQQRYPSAQIELSTTLEALNAVDNQTFDMIIANLFLPYQIDFKACLQTWKRLLRIDGVLMLTALGPDTLQAWRDVFAAHCLLSLIDMHDLGDFLLQLGFADPVLDVAYFNMSYTEKNKFLDELKLSEMLEKSCELTEDDWADKPLTAEFEVIFAHGFGKAEKLKLEDGVSTVPLSMLRDSLKGR